MFVGQIHTRWRSSNVFKVFQDKSELGEKIINAVSVQSEHFSCARPVTILFKPPGSVVHSIQTGTVLIGKSINLCNRGDDGTDCEITRIE